MKSQDKPWAKKVAAMQARVTELETQAEEHQQAKNALSERLKELRCLNSLSKLTENQALSLEAFLQSAADLIPPAYQWPENTCARISCNGQDYLTAPFVETEYSLSAELVVDGRPAGSVAVFLLTPPPPEAPAAFLELEQALLDSLAVNIARHIEHIQMQQEFAKIAWMLSSKSLDDTNFVPEYGDLSLLNQDGLILSAVGYEQLKNISSEYLDLLETSSAIYERNGDYALGLFSSGWCQMMDAASRKLCETESNADALASGRWLCHESCWKDASLPAMTEGKIIDIDCNGGIHLYAVPVRVGGEIVGAINFGYGTPPTDELTLQALSDGYQIPVADLKAQAAAYQARPPFIIDYAKTRIQIAAAYLGSVIERAKSEKALAESETNLRAVINGSPLAIISLDPSGIVQSWNQAAEHIFGWTAAEVLGKTLPTVGEDQEADFSALLKGYAEDQTVTQVEVERMRKDGTMVPVRLSTAIIHDDQGKTKTIIGMLDDITERKQAEKEIKILSRFPEENPNPVMRISPQGEIQFANRAAEAILKTWEKEVGQVLPMPIKKDVLNTLQDQQNLDIELTCGEKIFLITLAPIVNENYVNFYGRDITERKQQAEALRKTSQELQAILDHSPLLIIEIDLQGNYLLVNQAVAEMFEDTPASLIGKSIRELLSDEEFAVFMERIDQVEATGRSLTIEDRLQVPGGERTFLSTLFPLWDATGKIRSVGSIAHDITERKMAEDELHQLKDSLEAQVAEKTIQLRERVLELEQFFDATVEREFRMKELRDEIERLNSSPGSD